MKLRELLDEILRRGIKLEADGDKLRIRAPNNALTPELRNLLAERKTELLSLLQKQKTSKLADSIPLLPIPRDGKIITSFAQQRLWFLDQLDPGSPAYNISYALRLKGPLCLSTLERSINEIIRRHEALRTTIKSINGQPFQFVLPSLNFTISVKNLIELSKSEREAKVTELCRDEAKTPFELAIAPLVRVTVIRLEDEEHIMLLTMHHIISDGWSMGIFFRELSELYEAFSTGKPSPLPELPIQYADFALWQREWLKGGVLQNQLSYWKQQLDDVPGPLALPTYGRRPTVQAYRGSSQSLVLSKSLSDALMKLSLQHGATLFMTLLAAFKVLLYRYTGEEDIVVGTPIANRNRKEIEYLIGFFANTLVLRTSLSGSPSFVELLSRVREVALQAYEHQDLPFEKLVEEVQPERDLSHSPLFQVMFALLQNVPRQVLSLPQLSLSFMDVHSGTSKFDLGLFIDERNDGLLCKTEYNTDLFDASAIQRMLSHFTTVLEGIVTEPDTPITQLPLLTEAEGKKLLAEWNDTKIFYPKDKRVHQLFEEQVELTPDAIAVVFEDNELSYRQLNSRANQLAHYLNSLGVGPETLVGICVHRSLEMIIGILGILKAGGAYVPLDTSYPKDRLEFMLMDTKTSLLLTQETSIYALPDRKPPVVFLDSDWEEIALESTENPRNEVSRENLAYVLYTSGSTGKPKGISMAHDSLCNLILWQLQNSSIWKEAKTLQFASFNFDVSFQEIFCALCSGGTLFLISDDTRRDPLTLLRYIDESSIERLFLPFLALQQLTETSEAEGHHLNCLREIITAGEQLDITQGIMRFFTRHKDCILYNQYGPTESHVVTAYALSGIPNCWPKLPPIGQPITNTQIYILDKNVRVVPEGIQGELHIGGVGLSRCYCNRPDYTADMFIPNPYSDILGERLYRTGDFGRYLPDGNIQFFGRIDNQVKIRGFRVELGEIDFALAAHPAVRHGVTVEKEYAPGKKCLVAYVVSEDEQESIVKALRSYLKEKLPDYMLPSAFVVMEELPLTPSGKVDRRALPPPNQSRPDLGVSYKPPNTYGQEVLTGFWREVLKIDRIGVHDNFFELGGHSLLATQVASRIREVFQVEFPLRSLFETPTVDGLLNTISRLSGGVEIVEEIAKTFREIKTLSEDDMNVKLVR